MNILIFAPHPDDEVLGCGGVMAKYASQKDEVTVCIVTSGQPPIFDNRVAIKNNWPHPLYPEIRESHTLLHVKETIFLQYPAANLESIPRYELNQRMDHVIQKVRPEVIYMPHFGDMQRDHALVSEAVMVAARPRGKQYLQKIYAYETLSETEWNIPHVSNIFLPNTFVDISDFIQEKISAAACYKSQISSFPEPRSLEAIETLAKLRGSTMGSKAAEAFSLIRDYQY